MSSKTAGNQSARHHKRSRASDAGEERTKRRRTSDAHGSHGSEVVNPSSSSNADGPSPGADKPRSSAQWSFSRPVGGRYSNLDPILTQDEAYLFVGLDTAVQVFATSTSRLVRTLQMQTGQKIIGYRICPVDSDILYIFTSAIVTKWHWDSGKRLDLWGTNSPAIAIDLPSPDNKNQLLSYSIVAKKDGRRQVSIDALSDKKVTGISVLETREQINTIQVAYGGRIIVASDGSHLFLGTTTSVDFESSAAIRYTWAEATLPVTATCLDLRETATQNPSSELKYPKGSYAVDLVVGESNGSLLIYRDIGNTLFGRSGEKKSPPRKLHWHRSSVNTVRWSRDGKTYPLHDFVVSNLMSSGNYLISGGQEPVVVMWQLDTGRTQTLPHLSSPVCNVIVSPSGNSYVAKLADNSMMIFPATGSETSATVIGLQLNTDLGLSKDTTSRKPFGAIATLHPQHPERLLIAVPASHQASERPNSAVLQTFDIRTNSHISRQALARTNTTTLNVGPDGSSIIAPDIWHMDIAQDGKWLATVDTWTPHPQDMEALARNVSKKETSELLPEIFLKFWKWNTSSSMWELVTRIDGPHFNDTRHSTVLGIAARPYAHEFASLGADALLRFWCPTAKHRSGLKVDAAEQHLDTWKCRNFVDLTGCLDNSITSLTAACMSFSEDGSVLAVCLPSVSAANDGLVLLVDARNCTVHYRRAGAFLGTPCSVKFLGRNLIIASTGSVAVWDTVDDVVKPIHILDSTGSIAQGHPPLVAVNPRTQSFAVAMRGLNNSSNTSNKKRRKFRSDIRIYNVSSLDLVFQETLGSHPLALLSEVYSGDYVIIDVSASVQRLGCLDKGSQKSLQPREITSHLNTGLASIFSRGHEMPSTQPADGEGSTSQHKGLASVFGDTPSFSLPALGVLFRNVVQTLGSS
ncbi:uncharacterized protein N7459_006120 [Penicillium hispanicum]|uniref:uncharacterized protein n=1 Tax=Penicillium hispanicum TaxID=1080232 RepID=UPI0025412EC5|nr:uncharacterized protein N7459_006120 [Penicillium hispanicum]KAJ5580135.1 hypothetical protein N7459_006120 [Penicillium hispanicum]